MTRKARGSGEGQRPNEALRSARDMKGWSQRKVAEELGTNENMVSRWECGESKPSPYYREKLCVLFGKDAVELGFLEALKAPENTEVLGGVEQTEEVSLELSHSNAFSLASLLSTNLSSSSMLQFSAKQSLYEQVIGSPEVLQLLQKLGVNMNELRRLLVLGIAGAVLLPHPEDLFNPETYERLRHALRKPSAIDDATLNHLEGITNDCWKMIPVVAGVVSHHSRAYVLEHLETVTRLLESAHPTMTHERLCSIAGKLSLIAANISSNMRDYSTAKAYYELSIEAAQEARNSPLQAVSLVRLSFNSTRSDRADVALPLLNEATYLITQSGNQATVTTRSWIAAALAEVHANLKDAKACFEVLEQAELQTDFATLEEDPYHTTFSSSLLAGYKGACYTLLHLPEEAEKVLNGALKQLPASPTYQKGYILSDLAGSCIQQGKVEEMYKYASDALTVAVQTRAPEVFQRVRKLRGDLDLWASTSYVKNLDKQIYNLDRQFYGRRG